MGPKNINICNTYMIIFPQNNNNISKIRIQNQILIPKQTQIQVQTQNNRNLKKKKKFLNLIFTPALHKILNCK